MSAATSQPIPEFYTWGFSGAPIQIQLDLDAARDPQADSGLREAPGLLVGLRTAHRKYSKPGVTRILDFKPLKTLDAASIETATANWTLK